MSEALFATTKERDGLHWYVPPVTEDGGDPLRRLLLGRTKCDLPVETLLPAIGPNAPSLDVVCLDCWPDCVHGRARQIVGTPEGGERDG